MQRPLIFGIGMNKTGTSSLTVALYSLGFPCLHSSRTVKIVAARNRAAGRLPLEGLTDRYAAFCDSPINFMFKELDAAYPGSRFILTLRELGPWIASRLVQFGGTPQLHIRKWNRHVDSVREHFASRPQDLLEYPLCEGAGWEPLCEFLNRPVPSKPFPWNNRTSKRALQRVEGRVRVVRESSTKEEG